MVEWNNTWAGGWQSGCSKERQAEGNCIQASCKCVEACIHSVSGQGGGHASRLTTESPAWDDQALAMVSVPLAAPKAELQRHIGPPSHWCGGPQIVLEPVPWHDTCAPVLRQHT
eukprot:1151616-Pelagomonas_calceolata.AAC.7